jgi:mono/diheme cytochrome c family protein
MDEPELRAEVVNALLALAGAGALVVLGIVVRRVRWAALPAAGVIVWFAVPHFDLLLLPATRTSFYQSPTGFSADSIAAGARLYPVHCAGCHGVEGRGDGALAKGMNIPPADLTAGHLWAHPDGELFGWLAEGMRGPDGAQVMPGFASVLSDDDRWALIDFIRARNAGLAFHADGAWPAPLAAPGLQATCDGETDVTLDGYRGQPVRVVGAPPSDDMDIATMVLAATPHGCAADAGEARRAYAEIVGIPVDQLADWTFLVDSGGWLRAAGMGLHGVALLDAIKTMGTGPAAPVAGHHH